jgi:protein TonB
VNGTLQNPIVRRWPETMRWTACFLLALCFHAVVVSALLARWTDTSDLASAPVITIELAPIAATPDATPNDAPPDPDQAKVEPEKKVEPEPQTELQVASPPKPKEEKSKPKQTSPPTAPSRAQEKAEHAAEQNWQSLLVSKLERAKRYPAEARARGEQGVAQLAFSIDRKGGVHNARIVHSSGSELLDSETMALIARAQPLPPPPPELAGAEIAIVVPIRYNIR